MSFYNSPPNNNTAAGGGGRSPRNRRHEHHQSNQYLSPPSASSAAIAVGQSALRQLTSNRTAATVVNSNLNNVAAVTAASMGGLADRLESTSLGGSTNENNDAGDATAPLRQLSQQQRIPPQPSAASSCNGHLQSSSNASREGWTTVHPDPLLSHTGPCQRSLHAAAIVHDSLYVFGGYDGQHRVNDFYQYNFTNKCWKEIVTANSHLVGGTSTASAMTMNAIGQHHHRNNTHGNGGRQDPPAQPPNRHFAGSVLTATGTVPTPRDRHAAVVHGSTFYIFGGFDGTSRVSDLYGFDVHRLVWRLIVPRISNAVVAAAAAVVGGGGGDNNNDRAIAAFHNINVDAGGGGMGGGGVGNILPMHVQQQQQQLLNDPDGQQQQQQQRAAMIRQYHDPPSPRHSHAAVVYQDCMYVFGGYDGSYRSDFHEFNFLESSWRPVFGSGRSPRARYRSTACVHDDTMILFGGHDGTRHLADVHTFDFVNNVWGLLVIDGVAPLPRDSHVSVVYKDSVFVFGGSTGSAMNDLHELMLPPSSSSFSSEQDQQLQMMQQSYNADLSAGDNGGGILGGVWNNNNNNGSPEDGGGRPTASSSLLLPRTAKWRQIPQMSGEGIAVHRFCHVGAVYNGSFYVFGGYDGSQRLNDFVKYDLAADDLLETDIPPPSLLADLRSFLDDEDAMSLSDITLMVEGIPVRAHKLMLMRCPYFKAMLLSNMSESKQSIVYVEIVRHRVFLVVLEYLYTDDVDIPLELAMELFVAADLFAIPRLQSMCERRLLESMTVENAATIFHTADVHSALSLRGKALGYILSHFEAVSKTDAFEDMARSNVELVFEILRSR